MAWRLAKSLQILRGQVDLLWPKRDRTSDGALGDSRHAATKSDHNVNEHGVVTALDIDKDLNPGGPYVKTIVDQIIASRDPRVKYIIHQGKICAGYPGPSPWVWRPYIGKNAHFEHMHISVRKEPQFYDSTAAWLGGADADLMDAANAPDHERPTLHLGSAGTAVMELQRILKINADGDFGPRTKAAVIAFQKANGLKPDAFVGEKTWSKLLEK